MWAYAVVLGAVQALFFALYFFRHGRRPGNIYLALFFLTVAASIVQDYMYGSGAILAFPHLSRLGFPITAIMGVLYYLAVSDSVASLSRTATPAQRRVPGRVSEARRFHKDPRMLLFLLPAGQIAYLLPYYLSPASSKLKYIREDLKQVHLDCEVMYWMSLIYLVVMFGLSLELLRRNHKVQRGRPRAYLGIWLGITWGLLVFPVVWFGLYLIDSNMINRGVVGIIASLFILLLAAKRVYFGHEGLAGWQAPEPEYKKSLLSHEEVSALGIQAARYLESGRDYLQAEFRPADLARGIDVSPHTLSQVLNRNFNKSFHELINEYRVGEAARRLRDPHYAEYTILRIALDCGFNSKSTFNQAFRAITGRTPSDFRRKKGPTHLERSIRTS